MPMVMDGPPHRDSTDQRRFIGVLHGAMLAGNSKTSSVIPMQGLWIPIPRRSWACSAMRTASAPPSSTTCGLS